MPISSTKDVDEADASMKRSNSLEQDSNWNLSFEHAGYRCSFDSVHCPVNSDDELTPEEVIEPLSSCEIDHYPSLPRVGDDILSSCLGNEFWNFHECDREDPYDQHLDSNDLKSEPAFTTRPETNTLLISNAHTNLGYRTSLSTGRICYDSVPIPREERDLASMLESGCSMRDSV